MAAPDDRRSTRIPASCPAAIAEILNAAWAHDLATLKPLLAVPGRASVQEPTTGETPLHAAVRSELQPEGAQAVVQELFLSGAIWNDTDDKDETPGCVAARLERPELYQMCVEAGVRAELLFGLLDGYQTLSSDPDEDPDEDSDEDRDIGVEHADAAEAPELNKASGHSDAGAPDPEPETTTIVAADPSRSFKPARVRTRPSTAGAQHHDDDDVRSGAGSYLRSPAVYSDGKLVDSDQNGVMMEWETSIMRASVDALLPPGHGDDNNNNDKTGKRILNVGFGLGIIDHMFQQTRPSRHHIIEAHPDVLAHINGPDCKLGPAWEASGPGGVDSGAYRVHAGKWQEVVPRLLAAGETYDAIYFDTFGEDYADLCFFFTEHLSALLDASGRFGFFNGLGADRQICYHVYTKVVEMHLSDAGLDVEWKDIDVDMKGLENEGSGKWDGITRRYWTLDKYRLPTCSFMT